MNDLPKALRILGVSLNDDAETIRKAWRALVRTYRPDTARRDPLLASKKLADINTAFEAVCAAESGALEKLRVEIEDRAQQAERDRRDAQMLRERSRRKREKLVAAARALDKECAKSMDDGDRLVIGQNTNRDTGDACLTERAEKGFLEAMGVCSLLNFANARSSYA
ncbi:MAG: J domain-containing protein [Pseudomonadota bacterium]